MSEEFTPGPPWWERPEFRKKSTQKESWFEEYGVGCLIVAVILGAMLWIAHATYDPNAPDPYKDEPLKNPDYYRQGQWRE